jgi:hypothetical protein
VPNFFLAPKTAKTLTSLLRTLALKPFKNSFFKPFLAFCLIFLIFSKNGFFQKAKIGGCFYG